MRAILGICWSLGYVVAAWGLRANVESLVLTGFIERFWLKTGVNAGWLALGSSIDQAIKYVKSSGEITPSPSVPLLRFKCALVPRGEREV